MNRSKIDWTDYTWNPVTGCRHKCPYCYARRQSLRFSGDIRLNLMDERCRGDVVNGLFVLDQPFITRENRSISYPFGFAPTLHEYRFDWPGQVKNGANIFVCSMADLFGDWVPQKWIDQVFETCLKYAQHNYLFLTKNPARVTGAIDAFTLEPKGPEAYSDSFKNFWFGASITSQEDIERASEVSTLEVGHRFLSIEPLLGPVDLADHLPRRCKLCGGSMSYFANGVNFDGGGIPCPRCIEDQGIDPRGGIDWVIIGAETGRRKGKVIAKKEWVRVIVRQCHAVGVLVFMKESLRDLMGDEFVQEFPAGLLRKEISPQLKEKLWETCKFCGTEHPKKTMIALLYRRKRGEGAQQLAYACPDCFDNLQAAMASDGPCEIKEV